MFGCLVDLFDFCLLGCAKQAWPVFDLGFAKVGSVICRDAKYPESARCVALGGAGQYPHKWLSHAPFGNGTRDPDLRCVLHLGTFRCWVQTKQNTSRIQYKAATLMVLMIDVHRGYLHAVRNGAAGLHWPPGTYEPPPPPPPYTLARTRADTNTCRYTPDSQILKQLRFTRIQMYYTVHVLLLFFTKL